MRFLLVVLGALAWPARVDSQEPGPLAGVVSTRATVGADAPLFERMIGTWDVLQRTRSDAGWPETADRALWIWTRTLGGSAVQDYWIAPPGHDGPGWEGQIGTNVRIFGADADAWRIVWTATDEPGFAEYRAVDDGDRVVMTGAHPGAEAPASRITYRLLAADTLDWLLEFRRPDGGWIDVSRARAVRRPPASAR